MTLSCFVLQRHTTQPVGVMVWGAIAYDIHCFPSILIHGTIIAQRYVYDIVQSNVLALMAGLPGATFQQENARQHTARMAQDSAPLPPFFALLDPQIYHQSHISGIIWNGKLDSL
ncbi:uncharacterized protein TNCV_954921 [Trichonephila clavipes]|nr:uncharacterized protein TNCV_954921 [Trichonephila clavipes]